MLPIKIELKFGDRVITEEDLYRWLDGDLGDLDKHQARVVVSMLQRLVIDLTLVNRSLITHMTT